MNMQLDKMYYSLEKHYQNCQTIQSGLRKIFDNPEDNIIRSLLHKIQLYLRLKAH